MAPEQAGNGKATSPHTDVYGLGAILYELLMGRPLFKGPTPMETMMQVLTEDVVPLSRLQPKIPADLETICCKCLQKEPSKRYASATALAEDLDRFRRDEPIQARPVARLENVAKLGTTPPSFGGGLRVGFTGAGVRRTGWQRRLAVAARRLGSWPSRAGATAHPASPWQGTNSQATE
jgi:serine/threonine protein kinase